MHTQCNPQQLEFAGVERRRVVAAFDGGMVSSDGGALLLARTDEAIGLIDRLAKCFRDHRVADLVEHSVRTLVGQRVLGIAAGYEDLNDHDALRKDPLWGAAIGKLTPRRRDCAALAGKSTLNRHLLCATLRPANIDGAAGAKEEVERIVAQSQERWPATRIILRADSGFAREALMAWCEENRVDYVFGLARNTRLVALIEDELATARAEAEKSGQPARRFKDFHWSTLDSWSRRRRVVAKAEWTKGEANPRFVVTSLKRTEAPARRLYEDIYCARGDMENRIKECQLDLYADRTSAATMRANQLRLWFASMAYVLVCALRRIGLAETVFADATCGTIRLKLLKIGALVRVSVRRIKIAMASACPSADAWGRAVRHLSAAARARAAPV